MKKIALILLLLIAGSTSLMAQRFDRRGFALGADRDTLLYIIASPFDNWYLNLGGGIQTFIGNEIESSARHNKLNFNISAEVGKWIIPDVAISVRLNFMSVDGQTRYGLNPFVDFTGVPVDTATGYAPYQPFHVHAFTAMGFVTFDWTNFLSGYERGKRKRLHWFTPIGLGMSMLFGSQDNPRGDYELGSFRRNFELAYSFRFGAEYTFSEHFAMNATVELFGSESTWDWSPYDNSRTIFDIIPSFNIAAKFNLLKTITKYNLQTRTSSREKVNHEFLAFGTRNTVKTLNGKIEKLMSERDSIENLAGERTLGDSLRIDSLNREMNRLQDRVDHLSNGDPNAQPGNIFTELIDINEVLHLPAVIVYYQLDKYDLDYNARKRLQDFAREASQLDDTVEFFVIGAADSVTGSIRHNQWLSERRTDAAYNMLVNNYSMSANQLVKVAIGGIMHYDPKENNRMTLIIQRTPVTEEIVDRWLRQSRERLRQ
ncbi:MAG: OmpA family protein [Bacteroidales bacterium]|nr:OmpA family protein [Bacteroidales bacterium]